MNAPLLTPLSRALLKIILRRPEADALCRDPQIDFAALEREAARHFLAPLLYRSLGRLGLLGCVNEPVLSRLRDAYLTQASRAESAFRQMLEIKQTADALQIPVIFLKGLVSSVCFHEDIAARNFCDIDILLHYDDCVRFHSVLTETDWRRSGFGQDNRFARRYALNHWMYLHPNRIPLEVHWRIHQYPFLKISEERLWSHAGTAAIHGEPFRCLGGEPELVLQLFSAVTEPSLRRFIDIRVILEKLDGKLEGGWDGFFERRQEEKTARLCADRLGAALWMTDSRNEYSCLRDLLEKKSKGAFECPPKARPGGFCGRTFFKLRLFGHLCVTIPWWVGTAFWRSKIKGLRHGKKRKSNRSSC